MSAPGLAVAVLGAGIMGSSVALLLARRGAKVTLFDVEPEPFRGASRWNEGKIHLGYLYAGDPSLETAKSVLPGGLAFRGLTEKLIGASIGPAITAHDDTYLIHRESVATPEATARYFDAVTRLAAEHPDARGYLAKIEPGAARMLSRAELARDYDGAEIAAGFRVPERSVATRFVADRFAAALTAEPNVTLAMGTGVVGVRGVDESRDAKLRVETAAGADGPYDFVVNALWHGRLAIDAKRGLLPAADWTHRYRLSLFVRTRRAVWVPSTVIATGPFGDVKNYGGRDFYLSWYAAGLVAEGASVEPPRVPALDAAARRRIGEEVFARLGRTIPAVREIAAHAEETRLEGGWVFARGSGSLADPRSGLHRRDRIGIRRDGRHVTVDTGKYSIAPWLAERIAAGIAEA